MKVILQKDVAKLGRRFEIVTVPDGYGFNKLIPQGMAIPATPENLKKVKAVSARASAEREATSASFETLAEALAGKVVDVHAEANEEGKLYQGLKASDIATAVGTAEGVTIDPHYVVVKSPIKTTGEHTIELAHGSNSHSLIINVVTK